MGDKNQNQRKTLKPHKSNLLKYTHVRIFKIKINTSYTTFPWHQSHFIFVRTGTEVTWPISCFVDKSPPRWSHKHRQSKSPDPTVLVCCPSFQIVCILVQLILSFVSSMYRQYSISISLVLLVIPKSSEISASQHRSRQAWLKEKNTEKLALTVTGSPHVRSTR